MVLSSLPPPLTLFSGYTYVLMDKCGGHIFIKLKGLNPYYDLGTVVGRDDNVQEQCACFQEACILVGCDNK